MSRGIEFERVTRVSHFEVDEVKIRNCTATSARDPGPIARSGCLEGDDEEGAVLSVVKDEEGTIGCLQTTA